MDNYKDILIAKFLAGETNREEEKELVEWLNLSDENKKYFQQMKIIWHSHKKINISEEYALNKIKIQLKLIPKIKRFWIYWQRIAAVLIIPIMVVGALSFFSKKIKPQEIQVSSQEVSTPFGDRVAQYGRQSPIAPGH